MSQPGFFDLDRRLEGLSAKGDPLETINAVVPWESFRGASPRSSETGGKRLEIPCHHQFESYLVDWLERSSALL